MLNQFGQRIFAHGQEEKLLQFTVGLEVERQRVNMEGQFSPHSYPVNIGDQRTNQWITNDFMETMSEVVTPVADNSDKALRYLEKLSNILRKGLADDELLWPLSMTPALTQARQQLEVAHTTREKRDYFYTWLTRHKLREATPCGLHINLGIHPSLVAGFPVAEVNRHYINIAQGFLRYRYLLTYLFGASPLGERSYFAEGEGPDHLVRSIRQSQYGFGTKYAGDFSDVDHYCARILDGVINGQLQVEHDFHSPVRLRGQRSVKDLPAQGVKYIELRMLDLNPWSSIGVSRDQVDLAKLMMAYFLVHEPPSFNLQKSDTINEAVALELPTSKCAYRDDMQRFLQALDEFAAKLQAGQGYYDLLTRLQIMVKYPGLTFSGRLSEHVRDNSLKHFALKQARLFQTRAKQAMNVYDGLGNNRVLSAEEMRAVLG